MPNRLQVGFLVSFFITLFSLIFLARWAKLRLKAAGYDISELILIGLPRDPVKPIDQAHGSAQPSLFQTMSDWALPELLALLLAFATSVFIYVKFAVSKIERKPVLDPQVWKEFPLVEKIEVSPNTAIYRFGLPYADDVLGLPIGQHISVSADINGKEIMRSYTPTSSDDDLGYFDLLIKSYEKGNISRYVSLLKIGDKVRIKGPKGQFKYDPFLAREIGMIAGGTGITPMLQIIRAALKNPLDETKLSLIYANVGLDDILLKEELDQFAEQYPDRFKVHYVLNNPPEVWSGSVGFVSKEQIEKYIPPAADDIKVLMCGPPPMMTAMKKHLAELNYSAPRTISKLEDQVFLF